MSAIPHNRMSFWMRDWPDELVVAEALLALCASTSIDDIETSIVGGWRATKVEVGQLRAAYRVGKGLAGGFSVQAPGIELRLQPSFACAPTWQVVGILECPVADDMVKCSVAFGAEMGAWTHPDGVAQAFRRRDLDGPTLPGGSAEERGPWLWSEPLEAASLESWMRTIARLLHGGTGDVAAQGPGADSPPVASALPGSKKDCHARATTSDRSLPSFMLGPSSTSTVTVSEEVAAQQAARPQIHQAAPSSAASAGTVPLDLRLVQVALAQGAIPFTGQTSPERLAELRGPTKPIDEAPTAEADADSTMFMPTDASRAIALETGDFARDLRKVPIPDLSVDHYAALSVEIEIKGSTPEVLRRHGIPSEASLQALHAEHGRRMVADSSIKQRFDERRAHFMRFAIGRGSTQ